jgi:hypothetical protein
MVVVTVAEVLIQLAEEPLVVDQKENAKCSQ